MKYRPGLAAADRSIVWYASSKPVTAFYKGESQGKKLPGDWKEHRFLPGSPAHVMLGGSWGSLSSQIHVAVDDVFGF
jgi:hypothetical protein